MTFNDAISGIKILEKECLQGLEKNVLFQRMGLCIVPIGLNRLADSPKKSNGIYCGFSRVFGEDTTKIVFKTFGNVSPKDLIKNNWEICMVERPCERTGWNYVYHNLRYHYFSPNYKNIWV